MDTINKIEGLLTQRLLCGDVENFINELKMLGVKSAEVENMDPFGEVEIGVGVANILRDLETGKSYVNDVNSLFKKLKISSKMFSSIGLNPNKSVSVDLHDKDASATNLSSDLIKPFDKTTIDSISSDMTMVNQVNPQSGNGLIDPVLVTTVEGAKDITEPTKTPAMNGEVAGIGNSTPSVEGNSGETIMEGVNMSERNFGIPHPFLRLGTAFGSEKAARKLINTLEREGRVDNTIKLLKSGAYGDMRKRNPLGFLGIGKTEHDKTLDKIRDMKTLKSRYKFEKKYGKMKDALLDAKIRRIGDTTNSITNAINDTLPGIAKAIKTTTDTVVDAKDTVAPNLTAEQIKQIYKNANGNIPQTFSEIEKIYGVDINSPVHDKFVTAAENIRMYSEMLEDPDVYYKLFNGEDISEGDVINFDEGSILVLDTLPESNKTVLNGIDLETGNSVMFNVANDQLYESTDFFDFDEGLFFSDLEGSVPVVSNDFSESDGVYLIMIDKVAKSVDINGPMDPESADKLYIQSAGTDNTSVLKANSESEANAIAEQARKSFVTGSLSNAGIHLTALDGTTKATEVSVGDVTTVSNGDTESQVLVDEVEPGIGDSTDFSVTILDSTDPELVGETMQFSVDNDVHFSVDDFYIEEFDKFFSELSEDDDDENDYTDFSEFEEFDNYSELENNKYSEDNTYMNASEVRADSLSAGDITEIIDDSGNKSEVMVNEVRTFSDGTAKVEVTALSSDLFDEGETFMFSADEGELFNVVDNAYGNYDFADAGVYWVVAENKASGERSKLGPFDEAAVEDTIVGLQQSGHKTWKFKKESEADLKVAKKLSTKQKIGLAAAGTLATAGIGVAADHFLNHDKVTSAIGSKLPKFKSHCDTSFSAIDLDVGDVVEVIFNETPTQVMISDGIMHEDGSMDFSGITLDDNIVESGEEVTFSTMADAEFGYIDTYDFSTEKFYSDMSSDEFDDAMNFSEEQAITDRLNEIKDEGAVAKATDEVKPGDVAKVDDTEIVITDTEPTETGVKVTGTVVDDPTASFSAGDEIEFEVDNSYIFSINDIFDFDTQTFFSEAYENNFALDVTPTDAPAVEVIEKKNAIQGTAPVDEIEAPVTRLLGEPATEAVAEGATEGVATPNFSESNVVDDIDDKMNYLMSV